jgi:hypothetical protein
VIAVARRLQVITRKHGSVKRWLDACEDHDDRIAVPHIGAGNAHYILAKAGYRVPNMVGIGWV